jgi:hypothetical protein
MVNRMMTQKQTKDEIEYRINSDKSFFKGNLPERFSMAWHGYLAAMFEWETINLAQYDELFNLLPKIEEPNPIATIFSGREDE